MSDSFIANPFLQSTRYGGRSVHLGISGSIACYKAAELLRLLLALEIEVTATLTEAAQRFISPLLIKSLGASKVYGDMFGEACFSHLEPGRESGAFIVAPASADVLAKFACGFGDDLLSTQFLAFDGPVVLAPAMNPRMWSHWATQSNVKRLADAGCVIVPPETGKTACGEEGHGRLAAVQAILLSCLRALSPRDLANQRVMVTLGPTREPWDGVRYWSNPSSGRMGAALATAAWLRGADVIAITGPGVDIFLPSAITRIEAGTASEMLEAASRCWPGCSMGIFCAAVADFAPVRPAGREKSKIAKHANPDGMKIEFLPNADILKTLAAHRKPGQKIMGFAAEITEDDSALFPAAMAKLVKKGADMIAANRVNCGTGAFGAPATSMAVVDKSGKQEIWPDMTKADIAWDLLSWLLKL